MLIGELRLFCLLACDCFRVWMSEELSGRKAVGSSSGVVFVPWTRVGGFVCGVGPPSGPSVSANGSGALKWPTLWANCWTSRWGSAERCGCDRCIQYVCVTRIKAGESV
jgi:hypothetical protein